METALYTHFENRVLDYDSKRKLPVTVVSGPLGSGKTTLINHILSNKANLRVTAIINDVAEINIDKDLVQRDHLNGVVELSNGCVCCSQADALAGAVWNLLTPQDAVGLEMGNVDYLLIETSGVTNPLGLVEKLDQKFGKFTRARLDCVVVVLDADCFLNTESNDSDSHSDSSTLAAQLAAADVVILNKADLIDSRPDALDCWEQIESRLQRQSQGARLVRSTHSHVPLSLILDIDTQDVGEGLIGTVSDRLAGEVTLGAGLGRLRRVRESSLLPGSGGHAHLLQDNIKSVSLLFPSRLSGQRLQGLLRASAWPASIVRAKGFIFLEEDGGNELVRHVFHLSGRHRIQLIPTWLKSAVSPVSSLVLIGRTATWESDTTDWIELLQQQQGEETDDRKPEGGELSALPEDPRWEWLCSQEEHGQSSSWLCRLSGAKYNGYSPEELTNKYGVDFIAMNEALLEQVQNRGCWLAGIFLTACSPHHEAAGLHWTSPDTQHQNSVGEQAESKCWRAARNENEASSFWLRWSSGPRPQEAGVELPPFRWDQQAWQYMQQAAPDLLSLHLRALKQCRCNW
jgi:G3E family GTPase